ncbi:MAG: hypothetical protein ACYC27_08080 [Armatimonadota bacterium]
MVILYTLLSVNEYASASIRVHPQNPHYFQDTQTGKPILFASDSGIAPTTLSIDNNALIADMINRKLNYGRVWHFLPWCGKDAIWPWERSRTTGTPMGGNKIDMNNWNPVYWNRLTNAIDRCSKAGIYTEIHLFDRCGMSPGGPDRWQGNPWASDNNINMLETPDAGKDGTPEFYQYDSRPNLKNYQERYVKKMIDETIKFDTVIYEIENEHWEDRNPDFAGHYAKFVKDYIKVKYPGSSRLVSYSSLMNDLELLYDNSDIDIINKHFGNEAEKNPDLLNQYIEPGWSKNKAINIDEFANGLDDPDVLRRMCWTIIASGGHFHIEDVSPKADHKSVVENIRLFMINSKWDFIHAAPDRKLVIVGDGYCMAQPGKEYLLYFPNGGTKSIDLAPSKVYKTRWWNTRKNVFSKPVTFVHKGGIKKFTTPDSGDWVLYISR